jgi:hypothetical protein
VWVVCVKSKVARESGLVPTDAWLNECMSLALTQTVEDKTEDSNS